ncbi:MAG TPA: pseudouridine-5'-phosphate glycosidase [Pyrinomonadaceae bacterium]|nr:pseudouridine-5'-phosphate glycosidase [Pyrinomonadaceae bacterium]
MKIIFSDEVSGALHFDRPVVALESTVIAHGLPFPQNIETAYRLERIVRENGATPATIAVFNGEIAVGLNDEQLEFLATSPDIQKLSVRDLPVALAMKLNGTTTVATTSLIAHQAGIKVFATGGIGGVHRGGARDISADLPVLARTPLLVVCSGAKIVLDLPATREWLETHGVTVLGWRCDEMPAFYSATSGLAVDRRVDEVRDVAAILRSRDELGLKNAVLLTVPVPETVAVGSGEVEEMLKNALRLAKEWSIGGKEITPFLLSQMSEVSEGRTLAANIALLENNVRIAAEAAAVIER